MKRKINWGILGCAAIARVRTIPGLLQASNANLYAVASRGLEKAEKLRDEFQAEVAYGSYEELLADEQVEAVYIPLPNALHYEWVLKAAKAKKHILCEKPLALHAEEADEMFRVCEENNVILMEAFAFRHAPLAKKVKEIVDQGVIGNIKYIESHLTDMLTDMGNIRMNQKLGGGAFYDMACYNVCIINYLMNGKEPEYIKAFAELDEVYGVDVSNTALFLYDNGVQAASYSSLNSYARGYYAIVGEKGRIEVPCNFNCRNIVKFSVCTEGATDNVEILNEKKTEYTVMCPDNYCLEIEQFGRCILEGEKPYVSKAETLLIAKMLDRMLQDAGVM